MQCEANGCGRRVPSKRIHPPAQPFDPKEDYEVHTVPAGWTVSNPHKGEDPGRWVVLCPAHGVSREAGEETREMKLTDLQPEGLLANVDVPGIGQIKVAWDSHGNNDRGTLVLQGIKTPEQLQAVLDRLTRGPGRVVPPVPETPVIQPKIPEPTPTAPSKEEIQDTLRKAATKQGEDAAAVQKRAQEVARTQFASAQGDYSALAAVDSFKDLVRALQQSGHKSFDDIKAAAKDARDSGACPLLVRAGDALDDRLLSACMALKVPGTANVLVRE